MSLWHIQSRKKTFSYIKKEKEITNVGIKGEYKLSL